jgi:hypothetical protein
MTGGPEMRGDLVHSREEAGKTKLRQCCEKEKPFLGKPE